MANLIMGREVFKSSNSSKSVTDACSLKTGAVQLDGVCVGTARGLSFVVHHCQMKPTSSV